MNRLLSRCLAAALLLVLPGRGVAALAPSGLFTDSMVLQRDAAVPVWGTATAGEVVTVSFAGQTKSATADAAGQWLVRLDAMPANGTAQELTIAAAGEKKTLRDVVVGDVWLCSGQSNMAYRLEQLPNTARDIAAAKNPGVRFFRVEEKFSLSPVADVKGTWRQVAPETAPFCSAVAYYFAQAVHRELGVPIGLLVSAVGGTRIETWTARDTLVRLGVTTRLLEKWATVTPPEFERYLAEYRAHQNYTYRERPEEVRAAKAKGLEPPPERPRPTMRGHDCPSALHHGMIVPLQPFAIRGVLWYQGESNVGNHATYARLQSALLADWRRVWGADLPFLFVQLAPHKTATPAIREAQFLAWQSTPRTAMVVTTDVGDADNIHPIQKKPVGERLAAAAFALTYGKNVVYSGPVFRRLTIDGARAVVSFDHIGSGLMAKGGTLEGFTIAGADGKFVAADARIEGATVVVSAASVPAPTAVRFGWATVPKVNLFNRDGFPAVPFRSDRPVTTGEATTE